MIPKKKTTGDNKVKSGHTKYVSRVSDVTFCLTSIAISETLSSLSSNTGPPKKKAKCAAGLGKKKCNTITDNTMNPYTGKLQCRLDGVVSPARTSKIGGCAMCNASVAAQG